MKGIFINCPVCKKMLFKNAYLRVGSFLSTKCFHCGNVITAVSELGKISLSYPQVIHNEDLTDDDENDIMIVGI